ncbi:hypothetical protein JCM10212_006531, partial [Sporobolomyces blumeae]
TSVEDRAESLRLVWLRATDALIASRVNMVHEENKHRQEDDEDVFVVGGKAYLSTAGLRFPEAVTGKFVPRYLGPFTVTAANHAKSTYSLDLPPHLRIHNKFHSSKLRPYFPNDDVRFPARSLLRPPPIVPAVDGAEEEWSIEKIVADKVVRGKRLFKVRYEGYSAADDLWRPEAELWETAPELLEEYIAARDAQPQARRSGRLARLASLLLPSSLSNPWFDLWGGEC